MARLARMLVGTLVMIGLFLPWAVLSPQSHAAMPNPAKVAELKMALRDLYIGHIFWVRDLVVSTRLGEKEAVSDLTSMG